MNIAVVMGRLSRPAESRLLESGSVLVSLQVTVDARPGVGAETVPVVCFDPPAAAGVLDVGDPVLVVGRVRRRFFQSGGTTQSRTEVVADKVVPTSRPAAVRSALALVVEHVAGGLDSAGAERTEGQGKDRLATAGGMAPKRTGGRLAKRG
jgi:single-strand DNA-binding protein